MSIGRLNSLVRGGCGQIAAVAIGLVMIGGLAYQGCGRGTQQPMANGDVAVASVSGQQIGSKSIEEAVKAQMQSANISDLPPSFQVMLLGQGLDQAIQKASLLAMAKEKGISVSDDEVIKTIDEELSLPNIKKQLVEGGQLKAGASDSEVEALVLKLAQRPLKDIIAEQKAKITADLKDPAKADAIKGQLITKKLLDQYMAKISPTDEQVKRNFDTLETKKVTFTAASEEESKKKAEEALAQIKSGTSFESIIDKNTPAPTPLPGDKNPPKKASDQTSPIPYSAVSTIPTLAPLKNLKAGEVSEPVLEQGSYALYKLVSVKNDTPADFATSKTRYVEQFKQAEAASALQADLKVYTERNKPDFSSDAYKALYDLSKLGGNPQMGSAPKADPAKLREIIDTAKRVDEKDPNYQLATMVRTAAFNQLYDAATDKSSLRAERIETLRAQVAAKEDFDARMTLAEELLGDRKYDDAGKELLAAAKANTDYSATGQDRFGKVASMLLKIKKDGTLSKEIENQILSAQDQWRTEKQNADKAQADAAAQSAKDAAAAKAAAPKPKVEDKK